MSWMEIKYGSVVTSTCYSSKGLEFILALTLGTLQPATCNSNSRDLLPSSGFHGHPHNKAFTYTYKSKTVILQARVSREVGELVINGDSRGEVAVM